MLEFLVTEEYFYLRNTTSGMGDSKLNIELNNPQRQGLALKRRAETSEHYNALNTLSATLLRILVRKKDELGWRCSKKIVEDVARDNF